MDMGRRQSTVELVAIDMDGTLLDPTHALTARAKPVSYTHLTLPTICSV